MSAVKAYLGRLLWAVIEGIIIGTVIVVFLLIYVSTGG